MNGIFDGISGVLNGVFGASVTVRPERTAAYEVRALFREAPIVVGQGEAGDIYDVMPTLAVQRPAAAGVNEGDVIEPGNGSSYRVIARLPSGSPAVDAFVTFDLERI